MPSQYAHLLTEEEKWHFDLHGYLHLRGVIAPNRLAHILEVVGHWLSVDESAIPAPVFRHRQEPYKTHLDHIQYGHRLFQELNADPAIIRVVAGLTMGMPRLFHCNFTKMDPAAPDDEDHQGYHRDDSGFKFPPGFRNPHNDYQAAGGEIYCSHLATWVALADVPEGTGFSLVPGSHKAAFATPDGLKVGHNPPVSITVPMDAGDVLVFSTHVLHDAAVWTLDYPRMNIFQRYQLSAYFNETGKGGLPFEEYRDQITEEEYELESLSKEEKAAVTRMRRHFDL
ncbi:MAG: phytanoyl-CoA dioxygenase family protein [Gemmatimonadetes bacterium]|nr:phytanoyl-CoA dioxygenase family protein [Gemmatimonadota bacterium]